MKKKKIVFVIESLELGGAEKSLVTLLQNFDFSHYEVDLLTFHPGGFFKDLVPKEVKHKVVPFPKFSLLNRLRFKIRRYLNKDKYHNAQLFWPIAQKYFQVQTKIYDIAIAYNQGFSTYYTAELLKAKVKYAWLNTDYQKAGYKIDFDYPYYQKFNKVITVSPEAHLSFTQTLNKMKGEIDVEIIKDITDKKIIKLQSEKSLKHPFVNNKINIVSIGRLVRAKGFHLAIETCKILKDKGYEINWYIIGEGNERKNLEELIQSNNLTESFFLLGADANPYPYMRACDIYVQTSLFEGLGLTLIEASYLNKPIVSTNFPTVYGILKDEETGLIAEMNAASIANKVERLINNKELREKFSFNLGKLENKDKELSLKKVRSLLGII